MDKEPVVHVVSALDSPLHPRYWLKSKPFMVIAILIAIALGCVLVSKLTNTDNNSSTERVLTVGDLDKPDVKINSETSDASVNNLTKELKAKIDKQIAAKENPFETVDQLAGVLSNTTNKTRQDQLTSFLVDFLAKRGDTLWFKVDSEPPDQAQVNYWNATLYAKLVYNYQFMTLNKFAGSDGKLVDTSKEQLKYINHYLALAQNPANWGEPQISQEDGHTWYYYEYVHTNDFIEWRKQLEVGGA